jgi:hypothetical protein
MKHWAWLSVALLFVGCGTNQSVTVLNTHDVVWGGVQTASDQSSADWDWTAPDAVLQLENKQTVIPIYPYALWDQATCHGDWPSLITVYGSQFQAPYPPCDTIAYSAWVTALVERYHSKVDTWQVLNLPVQQAAPTAQFVGPANVYGDVIVLTAQAIKQADPRAKVYIGPFNDLSVDSVTFFTELLVNPDVQANVDGLTINADLNSNWSAVESVLDQTNWNHPTYFVTAD